MNAKTKKKLKKIEEEVEENIKNWPNFLTLLRVILTFVLIYMFLTNKDVLTIVWVFAFAAFTDFLDGQVARRFNQVTKFGAKFDIIADRFLWLTAALLILITFPLRGIFTDYHLMLMGLVLTREILCFPFAFYLLFKNRKRILTEAKWSGKTTTFLQGFAIPLIIFSALGYSFFDNVSVYLAFVTGMSGIWATSDYLRGIWAFKDN